MYTVSKLYKEKIKESDRYSRLKGTLKLKNGKQYELDDSCFKLSSVSIDNQCVDGDEINLGSVYAGQLKCELLTDIDRFNLYDAIIELAFSLQVDYVRDKWEDVPLGVFTVTEATKNYNVANITALDNMLKFEKKLKKTFKYYGSVYGLLTTCCTNCKMKLGTPKEDIEAMCNGNVTNIYLAGNHKSMTYRDLISDIAEFLGGFATIDRHGKLVIRDFKTIITDVIDDKLRSSVNVADKEVIYKQVVCESKGETLVYNPNLDDDELTINLGENDLLQFGTLEERMTRLNNIGNKVGDIKYIPCELNYVGNPALDLGDRLEFTGGQLGDGYVETIITKSTWAFRNTHTITGSGKSLTTSQVLTKSDKIANETGMTTNSTTNYLITENTTTFIITNDDKVLHLLRFQVDNPQIVLMRTIICVNSTVECNITCSYEINGALINDFIPVQKINLGNNIINLIYPIMKQNIKESGDINVIKLHIRSDSGTGIEIKPLYSKTILNGNDIIEDVKPEYEEPDYDDLDPIIPDIDPYFDPDSPDYDFDYPICPYDPEFEGCPQDWESPDCPMNPDKTGELCPYKGTPPVPSDIFDPNNYDNGVQIRVDLHQNVQDGFMFQSGGYMWVSQSEPDPQSFATNHISMQIGKNSIVDVKEWDKIYFPTIGSHWYDWYEEKEYRANSFGDGDLLVIENGRRDEITLVFLVEFEVTLGGKDKVTMYMPLTAFAVTDDTDADYDFVIPDPVGIIDYWALVNPRMSMYNTREAGLIPKVSNPNEWVVPKLGVDYTVNHIMSNRDKTGFNNGDTWVCKGVTKAVVQCINEWDYNYYFEGYPIDTILIKKYTYLR